MIRFAMPKRHDSDSSYFRYRGKNGEEKTSASFLLRLQGHDSGAWKDFTELYVPLIRYWCRRRKSLLTRPERQDILQDVLQKLSVSIEKFDHTRKERGFRGWLRRITENRINDFLREKAKSGDVSRLYSDPDHLSILIPAPAPATLDFEDEIDSEQEAAEQHVVLKQILQRIKPEFREKAWDVFRLLCFAEKDSSEVAEIMEMTPDAVRKIRSRILKRLREEFAKLDFEMDWPSTVVPSDR